MTKITLPALPEGADGWTIGMVQPIFKTGPDVRPLWQKALYRVLMYAHDKAESLWHWCYYTSRRFAPPWPKIDGEMFVKEGTYVYSKEHGYRKLDD